MLNLQNFGPSLKPMIPNETRILKNISLSSKLEPLKNRSVISEITYLSLWV